MPEVPHVCWFCGETHPRETTSVGGLEIELCPRVPRGHLGEQRTYTQGPPDALHRLDGDKRPK